MSNESTRDLQSTPFGLTSVDYRAFPNTGGRAVEGDAETYDRPNAPGVATPVAPQPDRDIHCFDLPSEPATYNLMVPGGAAPIAGWSPDLPNALAWERGEAEGTVRDE